MYLHAPLTPLSLRLRVEAARRWISEHRGRSESNATRNGLRADHLQPTSRSYATAYSHTRPALIVAKFICTARGEAANTQGQQPLPGTPPLSSLRFSPYSLPNAPASWCMKIILRAIRHCLMHQLRGASRYHWYRAELIQCTNFVVYVTY